MTDEPKKKKIERLEAEIAEIKTQIAELKKQREINRREQAYCIVRLLVLLNYWGRIR
jgi:chromosome segregation ATPase